MTDNPPADGLHACRDRIPHLVMEPGHQARLEAARHIQGIVEAPDANIPGIIAGLLNLNTVTLFELAKARGARTEEMYYQVAGDYSPPSVAPGRSRARVLLFRRLLKPVEDLP